MYSVVNGVRTDGPKLARHRMAYEFAEFARIVAEHDTAAEAAARRRTLAVIGPAGTAAAVLKLGNRKRPAAR